MQPQKQTIRPWQSNHALCVYEIQQSGLKTAKYVLYLYLYGITITWSSSSRAFNRKTPFYTDKSY
jgi:hypothetical protein